MAPLFYLRNLGDRAEIEAGVAGTRRELYQRMLYEISGAIGQLRRGPGEGPSSGLENRPADA